MKENNLIKEKTFEFSLKIIELYKVLIKNTLTAIVKTAQTNITK